MFLVDGADGNFGVVSLVFVVVGAVYELESVKS